MSSVQRERLHSECYGMSADEKSARLSFLATEYALYTAARSRCDNEAAWGHLERAHIVAQVLFWAHIGSHWEMLQFAWHVRDWREVAGQIARLMLAPVGNGLGRLPIGNSGRARISAFSPMPIPDDLRSEIARFSEAGRS